MVGCSVRVQSHTKSVNFAGLYIFSILQHFATKLGNFADFEMLFRAVVKGFVCLACMDQNLVYNANCPSCRMHAIFHVYICAVRYRVKSKWKKSCDKQCRSLHSKPVVITILIISFNCCLALKPWRVINRN